MRDATAANMFLAEDGLSDNEQALAMTTANKGTGEMVSYEDMTISLLKLFGDRALQKSVALVAQHPLRAARLRPQPHLPSPPIGAAGAVSICGFCNKLGHARKDCPLNAKHRKEWGTT